MADSWSHPAKECANCGDVLRLNVQHPVVTRKEQDEFCYYSFCDDACKDEWEHRSTTVVFTDINGQEGVITDQLDVTYSGDWEAVVKAWTAERGTEWLASESDGADGRTPRLVLNLVMLELPDIAPIVAVERREAP